MERKEIRDSYKVLIEKLEGKRPFGDLGIGGRIILK
jgi:hypothetical protein